MVVLKNQYISFRNFRQHLLLTIIFILIRTSVIMGQNIPILRSSGMVAVIGEGTESGIIRGDYFVVKREINGSWKKITYVEATEVQHDLAVVRVIEKAPKLTLKTSDVVIKIPSRSEANRLTGSGSIGVSESPRREDSRIYNSSVNSQRGMNLVYLGPTAGGFVPLGDMKDIFETSLCYGGTVGVRFRQYLDVSIRFLYASKNQDWTFWNLQMVGRRYYANSFIMDFGYGVAYPEIFVNQSGYSVGSGSLRLGIIGGVGYTFPVALMTQFEIGGLLHFYPNFGDKSGQFVTIQGRLIF